MAIATPAPSPAPRGIEAVDVTVEELQRRIGLLLEQRHQLDPQDANYRHCATDHPELIPSSDWTPGGQQ